MSMGIVSGQTKLKKLPQIIQSWTRT